MRAAAAQRAFEQKLEAGLLLVGKGDLGHQHFDQHRGYGLVELIDHLAKLRPLLAGAAEEKEIAVPVDDDARAGGFSVRGLPCALAARRLPILLAFLRSCRRYRNGPNSEHRVEGPGQLPGLGVPDLVGEHRLVNRFLAPGIEGARPLLDMVGGALVRGEGDHFVHPF